LARRISGDLKDGELGFRFGEPLDADGDGHADVAAGARFKLQRGTLQAGDATVWSGATGAAIRAWDGEPSDGLSATLRPRTPAQVRVIETSDSTLSLPEPSAPQASAADQAPVTVTGCLEMDNETFRLKNTSGTNAPKARSWKSGFLKKNPASIQIVDEANRVQLPAHVGQRVVVTGKLVDREMQVRSLRRVATSCNQDA